MNVHKTFGKKAPEHLQILDVLRGVAVLLVLFFHLLVPSFGVDKLPWSGLFRDFGAAGWEFLAVYPLTYGSAGVAVFFVVSGFCIHLSHAGKPGATWADFTIRRFFRIMPPYWVALLFFFYVLPLDPSLIWSQPGYETLLAHILALHNMREWWFWSINGSFWTIAVEVQLYAIYPLLAWMVCRKGWIAALAITCAIELSLRATSAFLAASGADPLPTFIAFSPFCFWFSWSIGAGLAECYMRQSIPAFPGWMLPLVAVCFVLAPLCLITEPFSFTLASLLTAMIITRNLQARSLRIAREPSLLGSVLASVGVISYSLYLYHQPLIKKAAIGLQSVLGSSFTGLPMMVALTAILIPIFLLSCLAYLYIEKPAIRLSRRFVCQKPMNLLRKNKIARRAKRCLLGWWRQLPHLGFSRHCPVCGAWLRCFCPVGIVPRPDAACPSCGAWERHRLVWMFFKKKTDLFDRRSKKVLHIAPEGCFSGRLGDRLRGEYVTGDLLDPSVMVKVDVTDMNFPDNSFDVVYCSHVLEHVPDDRKAMREFFRVLKPGGWAILLVPITVEKTIEDPTLEDPAKRLALFGQEDHVRRYGNDYENRLREAGFVVSVFTAKDFISVTDCVTSGVATSHAGYIHFCTKGNDAAA